MESYKTYTCKNHQNLFRVFFSSFFWNCHFWKCTFPTGAWASLEVSGRTARVWNKERCWRLAHWESSSFPSPTTARPHLSWHSLEGSSTERECWGLGDVTLLFMVRGLSFACKLRAFLGLLLPLKLPCPKAAITRLKHPQFLSRESCA